MSEKNLLEVVRIKDPSGVERNATRAEAKRINARIVDGPVRDKYNRPIPAKPTPGKTRTDLAGQPVRAAAKNTEKNQEA